MTLAVSNFEVGSLVDLKRCERALVLRGAIFIMKGLRIPDSFFDRPCKTIVHI